LVTIVDLVELASVAPEILEPRLAQRRVARGVGDGHMAEPVLDRAGVDATQLCLNMWKCTGSARPARWPMILTCLLMASVVNGVPRSLVKTGYKLANDDDVFGPRELDGGAEAA
jgi:hypothetical protein